MRLSPPRLLAIYLALAVGCFAGCDASGEGSKPAKAAKSNGNPTGASSADAAAPVAAKPGDPAAQPKLFAVDPLDWPNWRGPEQNSISRETGLIDRWNPDPKHPENVLWVNDEAGSISAPIIMRGKLYTINRYHPRARDEAEQVLCLDAANGKVLWRQIHNPFLSGCPAERIGWASVVGDPTTGRVYAFGTNCLLQCLDGDTGRVIWSRSLSEEFGFLSVFGGRTNFPIVFEDLLLVSAVDTGWGELAKPAHRFLGLDKNTGEVRWYNGTTPLPEDTTYSTPRIAVIDGQTLMIFGSSDGCVWAFQPRTGKPVWHYKMSQRGLNVSPFVVGDKIFVAQGEENLDLNTQGMLLCFRGVGKDQISDKKETTVWKLRGVMDNKSSPLVIDGRVYVADDGGNFYIVDAEKGRQIKRIKLAGSRIVHASPLYAEGKIYQSTTGGLNILRPSAKGVEVVHQQALDEEADGDISAAVVVSHGRIYLTTSKKVYCLGKEGQTPAATPIPPAATESFDTDPPGAPTQVQIVPAEVLLKPGQTQRFQAYGYDAQGKLCGEPPASFSVEGPGRIDNAGVFVAGDERFPSASTMTVKVGDVTGHARIRVVPPLPWKFDFQKTPLVANPKTKINEGSPPKPWIGIAYRHVIREVDGRKVLVKINTIPKGTHSQGWMGPDDLHDYTIQADIRATTNNPKHPPGGMPDAGLIAQRYSLTLMGSDQKLRICYWPPQSGTQFCKDIPFPWKPDVWYSAKFSAENEKGKAILRGKVWPRGEKEPAKWTIEATDDRPNEQGSPGLIGDTSNKGEFYYDRIEVFGNGALDDLTSQQRNGGSAIDASQY